MKQRTSTLRVHNEWFQPIVKRGRCLCRRDTAERLALGDIRIFAWGEYVSAKWRTVDYFCLGCFAERIIPRLRQHANGCGCTFQVCARSGYTLPAWIKLPEDFTSCAA